MEASELQLALGFLRARARAASLVVLSVAGLVACNQLLGTDKYEDGVALDGGTPDGATDASDLDGGPGADGSLDATFDGTITLPPGSNAATWVRFHMPDFVTGAAYTPSYNVVDGGGDAGGQVVDTVTNLTWQQYARSIPQAPPTFADAKAVCDKVTPGAWRLPTRIELVSVIEHVNAGQTPESPAINPLFHASAAAFWTSSPVLPASQPQLFWTVDFTDGTLKKRADAPYVLCVKAK